MSPIGHPKKDKRQLSITNAFFRASQNKKELNTEENIHGDDEGIEEDQANIQEQPLKKNKESVSNTLENEISMGLSYQRHQWNRKDKMCMV